MKIPALQLQATKILIDKLPVEPINWRAVLQRSLNSTTPRFITIEDFRFVWLAQLAKLRESIDALRFIDVSPLYRDHSRQIKAPPRISLDKIKKRPREDEQSVQSDKSDRPLCTGCGKVGHLVATCFYTSSPYFNSTDAPYINSEGHKQLMKVDPEAKFIPTSPRPPTSSSSSSFSSSSLSSTSKSANSTADATQNAKKHKGEQLCNLNSSSTLSDDPQLIPFFIAPLSLELMLERSDRVYTLLDTGSFAGNFIHHRTILKHNFTQFVSNSPEKWTPHERKALSLCPARILPC